MDEQPPGDTGDASHPRARATAELGQEFAELLLKPLAHQLGVCGQLGIPWRKHMRWMAQDADAGSDLAAYQSAVIAALDAQRVRDLLDIEAALAASEGTHASSTWNMRKHRHESRFRRFYDDAAKHEVELSGPDKGPIETQGQVRYVVMWPPEEPEE